MSAESERESNQEKQRERHDHPPHAQPADRAEPRPPRRARPEKTEAKAPSKDITPLLKGWDYEPGTINVRRIRGSDGQPKLQMRVELGLLQMELTGRPDGAKPHGFDSLLDYFEAELKEHRSRHGTELGFNLTGEQ